MIESHSFHIDPKKSQFFADSLPIVSLLCRDTSNIGTITKEAFDGSLLLERNTLSKEWQLSNYYFLVQVDLVLKAYALGTKARESIVIVDANYHEELNPYDAPALYVALNRILEDPRQLIDLVAPHLFILEHRVYGLHQKDEKEEFIFTPVKASELIAALIRANEESSISLLTAKIISQLFE